MIANLTPIPADAPGPNTLWAHFKGQCLARVIHVGYHTETGELMVLYTEPKTGLFFARPLAMWGDEVRPGVKRFTFVDAD